MTQRAVAAGIWVVCRAARIAVAEGSLIRRDAGGSSVMGASRATSNASSLPTRVVVIRGPVTMASTARARHVETTTRAVHNDSRTSISTTSSSLIYAGSPSTLSFDIFSGLSHALLVTLVGLLAYVFGATSARVQFATEDARARRVDYASLLYTLGLVVVQGEALVVRRVHRHAMHWLARLVQLALQLAGVALAALLLAAFVRHRDWGDEAVRYSTFRSWIAIAVVAGFWLQGLVGVAAFLFPRARREVRGVFSPLPRLFGAALVVLAAFVLATTLQVYATDALGVCYLWLQCPGRTDVALNIAIFCLIGYVVLVISLISTPQWKRATTLDDKRVR